MKKGVVAVNGAHWIWLDEGVYPDFQKTWCTVFADKGGLRFGLAEFERCWALRKPARSARILVSGDTKFRLWLNDAYVGSGPVAAGGDYGNALPMPRYYANHYDVATEGLELRFFAQVQLSPAVMTDYSCGRGGFILSCELTYEDGEIETLVTDERWHARLNRAYCSATEVNLAVAPDPWRAARIVPSVWNIAIAPIPMLSERFVAPVEGPAEVCVPAGETREFEFEFDRIHSGHLALEVDAAGPCEIVAHIGEVNGRYHASETIAAEAGFAYRGLRMHSIGGYRLRVANRGKAPVALRAVGLIFTCYPVTAEGRFECSDSELTKIYEVGKWTLRICRQTLHLDSPLHQETLGCTGDYFVESLMGYFAFGDTRLTRLDIVRTADWLMMGGGVMFHTSYSLIWVQMLYDYYLYSGDAAIFAETRDALHVLMKRFETYLGENGVLEHPPNYMFVDWVEVDGYTMHHPPKALGQTCLNAFYHRALRLSERICALTGDAASSERYAGRAEALKAAFEVCFYDAKAGLYIDGLNTPGQPNQWQPENPDKRYYSRHSNALAVLYGLCDIGRAQAIMRRVAQGDGLTDVQPYFMHFVLEAVDAAGLFGEWGMGLLGRWREMVRACDKGLAEGWIRPSGYAFDHSHAWGGTPVYQLPSKMLGFQMLEPGFRAVSLRPELYGLAWAHIEVPTPYGMLVCDLQAGKPPRISAPAEIKVVMRA